MVGFLTESNILAINVLEIDFFVTSFLLYLLPPHVPVCLLFYHSFIHLFINFTFLVYYFFLLFKLLTYFLFFLPCPLVAVVMARHAKLSPSASCMTGPCVKVVWVLAENYRGALYLTSYHLQFYTQLTLNRLS